MATVLTTCIDPDDGLGATATAATIAIWHSFVKFPAMGRTFQAGQKVKSSGIYQVIHGQDTHYHSHEVTILSGAFFPSCLTCGDEVRFMRLRLARAVEKHSAFNASKEHTDDGDTHDEGQHGDTQSIGNMSRHQA